MSHILDARNQEYDSSFSIVETGKSLYQKGAESVKIHKHTEQWKP